MILEKVVQRGLYRIFDFLLPRICAGCKTALGENEFSICNECRKSMHPLPEETELQILMKLRQESGTIHYFRAPYLFDKGEVVQEIIHSFKYRLKYPIGRFIGEEIYQHLLLRPLPNRPDLIIPVPLHQKRRGERGFNQSAIIGKTVSKMTDIPFKADGLRRTRYTPKQAWMKKNERKSNIKNAFTVPSVESIRGKSVLLIDDVVTTGATVCECARTLNNAGCKEVIVVSFAAVL